MSPCSEAPTGSVSAAAAVLVPLVGLLGASGASFLAVLEHVAGVSVLAAELATFRRLLPGMVLLALLAFSCE